MLDAVKAAPLIEGLRPSARLAPESGIVEVMNYGRPRSGMIGLWAGEGDTPTPAFICEAATRSLANGETFYTWQRGIPELRDAIAAYHTSLNGRTITSDHVYVTGSGMQAIQIALAMVAGAGDEVLIPTPAWPNFAAASGVAGARVVEVPMHLTESGWTLDIERLAAAITPRTRVLFVNSPSNPTGWVASRAELVAVLALARRHGLWIIADEIYTRFWYGEGARTPSFMDIMDDEDRILFVNTFSKNWAMTGWRLGWILAHPALGQVVENLIQYSTSGVATFVQRAGIAALENGESLAAAQIDRARTGRAIIVDTLQRAGGCRFVAPSGAFYMFFAVEGESDSRALALRLVDEANIGLAPGTAFGAAGQGYMRLCFLRSAEQLTEAAGRLENWLRTRR